MSEFTFSISTTKILSLIRSASKGNLYAQAILRERMMRDPFPDMEEEIKIFTRDGYPTLEIFDEAVGIDAEQLPHVD